MTQLRAERSKKPRTNTAKRRTNKSSKNRKQKKQTGKLTLRKRLKRINKSAMLKGVELQLELEEALPQVVVGVVDKVHRVVATLEVKEMKWMTENNMRVAELFKKSDLISK